MVTRREDDERSVFPVVVVGSSSPPRGEDTETLSIFATRGVAVLEHDVDDAVKSVGGGGGGGMYESTPQMNKYWPSFASRMHQKIYNALLWEEPSIK